MRYSLLTFNNYVGLATDVFILKDILCDANIIFLDNFSPSHKSEVGIWIQNYYGHLLENFKVNIFYLNEEWFDYPIEELKRFNYVICKSNHAYNIVKNQCNAIYLPFISRNFYDPSIKRCNAFLHFAGRSIQKNTEIILKQDVNITLIDPYDRYKPNSNFNHVNAYQTNEQITYLLNSHSIHICCSLYESWGHYLFEGLSTGNEIICSDIPVFREQLNPDLVHFIPTQEKINTSYMYCTESIYKFRKSFFVDEHYFKEYIENFKPIGKDEERRKLYKHIVDRSKTQMINFFKNI